MSKFLNDGRTLIEKNDDTSSSSSSYDLALVPFVPFRFTHQLLIEQSLLLKRQKAAKAAPAVIIMDDVIPTILSFCDGKTLARAACVSRDWNKHAEDNRLWENLCRRHFGVSADQIKPAPDPVKLLYILSHKQLKSICSLRSHSFGIRSIPNVIPMSTFRHQFM